MKIKNHIVSFFVCRFLCWRFRIVQTETGQTGQMRAVTVAENLITQLTVSSNSAIGDNFCIFECTMLYVLLRSDVSVPTTHCSAWIGM
jgi:hypothetical protein